MMKRITLLLMVLTLAGCGAKFVYHNIDWFVIDYIEDYVELGSQQKAMLSDTIAELSAWQQQQEMPRYSHQLHQLAQLEPEQFNQQVLDQQRAQLQQHYQRLVMRLLPDAYQLANTLSDEQVEEFMVGLRQRQKKFADKYRDTTDSLARERYQARIEENLEQWFGSLNRQQESVVSQWVSAMKVTTRDWIAFQPRIRSELDTLFVQRHNEAAFRRQLLALLFEPEQFYSPVLRAKFVYNQAIAARYMVEIVHLASSSQMAYFRSELQGWQQLVQELSEDVGSNAKQPLHTEEAANNYTADAS